MRFRHIFVFFFISVMAFSSQSFADLTCMYNSLEVTKQHCKSDNNGNDCVTVLNTFLKKPEPNEAYRCNCWGYDFTGTQAYTVYCASCDDPYQLLDGDCHIPEDTTYYCQPVASLGSLHNTCYDDAYLILKSAYQSYDSYFVDYNVQRISTTLADLCDNYPHTYSCTSNCYGTANSTGTSGCNPCPTNATCNGSSTFTCENNNYPIKTDSGCVACPSNATCSGSTVTCNQNYYYDQSNGTCTSCASTCGNGFVTAAAGAVGARNCRADSGITLTDIKGTFTYNTACCCTDTCTNLCASGYTCPDNLSGNTFCNAATNGAYPVCSNGCCIESQQLVFCPNVLCSGDRDCLSAGCGSCEKGRCTSGGSLIVTCVHDAYCENDLQCGSNGTCLNNACSCRFTPSDPLLN